MWVEVEEGIWAISSHNYSCASIISDDGKYVNKIKDK